MNAKEVARGVLAAGIVLGFFNIAFTTQNEVIAIVTFIWGIAGTWAIWK